LVSVASDGLKALTPYFLSTTIARQQIIRTGLAFVLGATVILYSLCSDLGFAALNRADTFGARQAEVERATRLNNELDRIEAEIHFVPEHRGAGVVEADMAQMRAHPFWTHSNECREPTRAPAPCASYLKMAVELANAMHADELQGKRDKLIEVRGSLRDNVADADPQVTLLSNLLGLLLPLCERSSVF
jgi:hypothetical protein